MKMPPGKRTVIPPEGGWKRNSYYVVDVAWNSANPVHRAIFCCGLLNDRGEPGNYNQVFRSGYDKEDARFCFVHYMKVVGCIDDIWPIEGYRNTDI